MSHVMQFTLLRGRFYAPLSHLSIARFPYTHEGSPQWTQRTSHRNRLKSIHPFRSDVSATCDWSEERTSYASTPNQHQVASLRTTRIQQTHARDLSPVIREYARRSIWLFVDIRRSS